MGIDPGSHVTGYVIFRVVNLTINTHEYGTLKQKTSADKLSRLQSMAMDIEELLVEADKLGSVTVVLEQSFIGKYPRAGLVVSETRGVVIGVCAVRGTKIVEYSATAHKRSTTGRGNATKPTIKACIERRLKTTGLVQDTADAVSIALHHLATRSITKMA